jgi:hypothetical protein
MGSSLFDRFGKGFTLLRFNRMANADTLECAAQKRKLPLAVVDVGLPEGRELYGRDLALVRPDEIIAWRGDRIPDDPDGLLDIVSGR